MQNTTTLEYEFIGTSNCPTRSNFCHRLKPKTTTGVATTGVPAIVLPTVGFQVIATPNQSVPTISATNQGLSEGQTASTNPVSSCTTANESVGQCQLVNEDHGVLISSDEKTKDCSENQICYIGLPPRPTSIPQPDCAGSDGCACKQFASPGNMIEQIFGADFFNNMRSVPIVGGVVASIDEKAANVWLTGLFAVNTSSPPPDDLVPGANAETHIKFLSGCDDGNVCVSTMNIQKYAKKNVTVQDICISKTAFGTELRNISLGLPSKIVVTPAEINQVSRDKTEKMLVAADANDPQREMYAKLATSCFEHIPYSTIVYEALEKPVFTFDGKLPLDYNGWLNGRLDPDNGESTTDNLEKDDFQEGFVDAVYDAANGVVNAYTGQPLLKSIYDATNTLISWGAGPHWSEAMVKNNLLYGTPDDIQSLYNQCTTAPNGPALCGPNTTWFNVTPGPKHKVGRDFVMNLNEDFLDTSGMPKKQVHAIKQNLATCLDCSHDGKIATAIGCIPVLNLQSFIAETVFGIGLSLAGAFCILNIIVAAIRMQVSRGVPAEIEKGRKMITNSLIGILIIIFALFILRFVGVTLLRIPGLS